MNLHTQLIDAANDYRELHRDAQATQEVERLKASPRAQVIISLIINALEGSDFPAGGLRIDLIPSDWQPGREGSTLPEHLSGDAAIVVAACKRAHLPVRLGQADNGEYDETRYGPDQGERSFVSHGDMRVPRPNYREWTALYVEPPHVISAPAKAASSAASFHEMRG